MISCPELEEFERQHPDEKLNDLVRSTCSFCEAVLKTKAPLQDKVSKIRNEI